MYTGTCRGRDLLGRWLSDALQSFGIQKLQGSGRTANYPRVKAHAWCAWW